MSKGSKQRPTNKKKFDENWDKIFKKSKKDRKAYLNSLPTMTAEEAGIDVYADHVDMTESRKETLKNGLNKFLDMWEHNCPVEGFHLVGKGEPCNWCGKEEQ